MAPEAIAALAVLAAQAEAADGRAVLVPADPKKTRETAGPAAN